ncbi:GNAT family N-acetyltransferase [Pseudomonas sp. Fl5BN2]|uniref:GNAT family N-acetyltransferase n=1 Tax=unclassified Pseudomonas TaxID=196821 RepID=UPI0013786BA6|nr:MULTISPECIES: GNAT family N-acetyltransferase [unclassified Pseudomonas]NBF05980.1 GNAT family N-acetyltransferase [Pseudomonas sp. Fl5BN2]NBF10871.1 GNAT family N-acetyltransferase [Pseudomonas sp. Fl4BN1]
MTEQTPGPTSGRLIRAARPEDVPAMLGFDAYASAHPGRGLAIHRAVEQGQCWVEVESASVLGYLLLSHDFFDQGFVSLVVVAPDQQRRGVALRLLEAAQQACRTAKLFISTNRSNQAARALIAKAGFLPSGVVENLDQNDPELIYFKPVR